MDDSTFPSDSTEEIGRFLRISENAGHDINFSIINITTNKVIIRSNVRLVGEPTLPNLRVDLLNTPDVVKSWHLPSAHLEDREEAHDATEQESPDASTPSSNHDVPMLEPNDLLRRNFIIPQEDGQRMRAKIFKTTDDYEGELQ